MLEKTDQVRTPSFIFKLLEKRGFLSKEDKEKILFPKITSLSDPYKIRNMDLAVGRIITAYRRQERVLIYGDYDLDGTFGIALLYESLVQLGFENVFVFQPSRHKDGYGLHPHLIDELRTKYSLDLIITVDVGITGFEGALKAKEIGIDLIITDHHLPQQQLPDAFTIINPNQEGDTSGLGYLCGTGVGFFLILAIRKKLSTMSEKKLFDLKEILPYFAIATITDMVPLVGDNRLLLKYALDAFPKIKNLGLRLLLEKLNLLDQSLNSEDVGIKLAPKINALSRLDKEKKPLDLLFLTEHDDASIFIDEMLKLNSLRKNLQDVGVQECQLYLEKNKNINFNFLFFYSEKIHPGVTGLIANYFSNELAIPVFIGSLDPDTNKITGSGRKPSEHSSNLSECMEFLKDVIHHGGGHSCAVGFELSHSEVEAFQAMLDNYFLAQNLRQDVVDISSLSTEMTLGSPRPTTSEIAYDLELTWENISWEALKWLEFLGPYGVGFSEPTWVLKNVSLGQYTLLKDTHFKFIHTHPLTREKIEFLLFNPQKKLKDLIFQGTNNLTIYFKLKKNSFRGESKIQLLIENLSRENENQFQARISCHL